VPEDGKDGERVRVLGLFYPFGIGDDPHDAVLDNAGIGENGDGVPVGFAQFSPVGARHRHGVVIDQRFRNLQDAAKGGVECRCDVSCDFDVLFLIPADRHYVGPEQQDVGSHMNRIIEQTRIDPLVRIPAMKFVDVDRRLVGMRADEQPLCGDAGQNPQQLEHFRYVGLPKMDRPVRFETQRQPGGGHFAYVPAQRPRLRHSGERMVVGNEVHGVVPAGEFEGWPDHPEIVSDVGGARCLDAGEGPFSAGCDHSDRWTFWRAFPRTGLPQSLSSTSAWHGLVKPPSSSMTIRTFSGYGRPAVVMFLYRYVFLHVADLLISLLFAVPEANSLAQSSRDQLIVHVWRRM
jgi:hypothetical protein